MVLLAKGALIVGGCGVVSAFLGWLAARQIPPAPSSAADAPRPRLLRDTFAVVGHVTSRPALLLPILAVSWFWLFGATVVSGLPAFAKDVLFANEQVVTMMLALFAVGVGVGSIVAERLLHGEVSARFVPVAAAAMAFFAWDLHAASTGRTSAAELATVSAFLRSQGSWRIVVDLIGVAMAGGLFTVPLYAILQHESEPAHRARVIAANNIINALAMSIAAVGAALFLARGWTMGELFALCGLLTVPVALVAAWILRRTVAKSLLRLILRILYRVKVEGLEHARAALPKAVIAANHASFLDGLLLGAFLPGDPIFAVDTLISKQWWAKPFLVFVNAMPVDPTNPLSIRSMIRAVEAGSACVIFPEGRITTTGSLMKVYEGPAVIAERTKAALLPVRIEGAEFTPFSRLAGKVRRRLFPRIHLRVLPPRLLTAPEGVTGRARRVALRRALGDEMVQSMFAAARIDTTLFDALVDACHQHGGSHLVADDLEMRPLSYRGLITASYALGGVLARRTRAGERVGVLLPTSRASLVTFFALQAEQRVPAMLNFSTGAASAIAACRGAEIALIVTARTFIEKAKLQPLVAALEPHATILYLEDVKKEIGVLSRLVALTRSVRAKPNHRPARAERSGRGALHVRLGGHAEGRRPEPSQPPREPVSALIGRRHQSEGHRLQCAAGVSQLRAHGRPADAAARRRPHLPLPFAASLPDGSRVRLRGERDDPLRHRHVSLGLRPCGRQLRLLLSALHLRRRRAREVRDAARVVREIRHPDPRRLRRDRDIAGAGGEHTDALQGGHGGPAAARAFNTGSSASRASTWAAGSSSTART